MSGSAMGPIQVAVVALLKADSQLVTLTPGGIHDAVPDGETRDYLAVGEFTEIPNDTLEDSAAGRGSECTFTTHAYTDDARGAGYRRTQAINSRVVELLHDATLSVSGFTSVLCLLELTSAMRDEDTAGRPKRHIVSEFRVIVEAT